MTATTGEALLPPLTVNYKVSEEAVARDEEQPRSGPSSNTPPGHRRAIAMSWESFVPVAAAIVSALPTLLLIGFLGRPSPATLAMYLALLLIAGRCAVLGIESSCARWLVGFVLLAVTSTYKSAVLLANCDGALARGVLYAITALWECSNIVPVLGGEDYLRRMGVETSSENIESGLTRSIVSAMAPCQVKFVPLGATNSPAVTQRAAHIVLCTAGAAGLYLLVEKIAWLQTALSSSILFELECLTFLASMAVIALDIPSFFWQIAYSAVTSLLANFSIAEDEDVRPEVILPYGWVYSSMSCREFWSRWSRPATALIRRLIYHPLGGRRRWYISTPVMFLLNATGHFDLSLALVGEKREKWWMGLFGLLAAMAMLEMAGDSHVLRDISADGNAILPAWYVFGRVVATHVSLRVALYIMVYKCLGLSFAMIFGFEQTTV